MGTLGGFPYPSAPHPPPPPRSLRSASRDGAPPARARAKRAGEVGWLVGPEVPLGAKPAGSPRELSRRAAGPAEAGGETVDGFSGVVTWRPAQGRDLHLSQGSLAAETKGREAREDRKTRPIRRRRTCLSDPCPFGVATPPDPPPSLRIPGNPLLTIEASTETSPQPTAHSASAADRSPSTTTHHRQIAPLLEGKASA